MKKNRLFYTLVSIIIGLLVGSLILIINGTNPVEAYKIIILGAIGKPKYIGWTLVNAMPIILTGISVAFAFQTGLFNIGAEGQFIVGSIASCLLGIFLKLPPIVHAVVCLIGGTLAGAIWGGLVGIMKARFTVNEVISSIMLNWIAFYGSNHLLSYPAIRKPASDFSYPIRDTASTMVLQHWKVSKEGLEFFKDHKILKGFLNPPINWGIIVAILVAILIWFVLNKTTLGYRLKAVGFNRYAAEYGGIDIKKSTVVTMTISGAISGLAGACMMQGVSLSLVQMGGQLGYGFNGMAVSLIAANNPILCIPAGLLFAGLNYGGTKLTTLPGTYSEITKVVIGLIVFSISMPNLLDIIKGIFSKKAAKGENK
ncbi:ABC transporter permease [Peptoniphilus sp. GNH]|nr:branched-chain amino acid ABC transporter, permease protein [Clostridiales bacterium KA00134]UHR03208.1 ABC transporter permease [Peptoniphilus sp. GNH]